MPVNKGEGVKIGGIKLVTRMGGKAPGFQKNLWKKRKPPGTNKKKKTEV